MMGRAVALLLVMAAVGCTDGDAPPLLAPDLGMPADFAGVPTDGDGGAAAACTMTPCSLGGDGDTSCRLACGALWATCARTRGIEHCQP